MYALTGALGQTGSAVAANLLAAGVSVRLIVRNDDARAALSMFLPPDRPLPMVAARDIGAAAAQLLLEPTDARRMINCTGRKTTRRKTRAGRLAIC